MILLDGKKIAKNILAEVATKVSRYKARDKRCPGLATILIGSDPASEIYVSRKIKTCQQVGIKSLPITLNKTVSFEDLSQIIAELNVRQEVDGILVQMPLPRHLEVDRIVDLIEPHKDVDGFHDLNLGRLLKGRDGFVACTPAGILRLLDAYEVPIAGRMCAVIGRSQTVGKPMYALLLGRHGTVTVCHSKTQDIESITRQADVLVVAAGQPEWIGANMVKPGAAVVDVGIHRQEDGRIVGDVIFEDVKHRAGWLTPVPGGVGPLTIAMLMYNTCKAFNDDEESHE